MNAYASASPAYAGANAGSAGDHLLEQFRGLLRVGRAPSHNQRTPLQVQFVGFQIGFVAPLSPPQRQSELVDDRPRDLILYGENVLEFPIEPLGPQGYIAGDLRPVGR